MSLIEDFQEYDEQGGEGGSDTLSNPSEESDNEDDYAPAAPAVKRDLKKLFISSVKRIINLTRFMGSLRDGRLEKMAAARLANAKVERYRYDMI